MRSWPRVWCSSWRATRRRPPHCSTWAICWPWTLINRTNSTRRSWMLLGMCVHLDLFVCLAFCLCVCVCFPFLFCLRFSFSLDKVNSCRFHYLDKSREEIKFDIFNVSHFIDSKTISFIWIVVEEPFSIEQNKLLCYSEGRDCTFILKSLYQSQLISCRVTAFNKSALILLKFWEQFPHKIGKFHVRLRCACPPYIIVMFNARSFPMRKARKMCVETTNNHQYWTYFWVIIPCLNRFPSSSMDTSNTKIMVLSAESESGVRPARVSWHTAFK